MMTQHPELHTFLQQEQFDEALRYLERIERERPLYPSELVLKGRWIQLASGVGTPVLQEAANAFRAALRIDNDYVPALLELAWFHYAVADDSASALPVFEQALELVQDQLKEAMRGKTQCLEDLESAEAAQAFVRQISEQASRIEEGD
jgi:tetratricopeptide (TPR) repeat protein